MMNPVKPAYHRVVRTVLAAGILVFGAARVAQASPVLLSETFDDISTLGASGWTLINQSSPAGTTDWFQGNPAVFPAQAGAADAYIAANFNGADFGGAISEWLITPVLTLNNLDTLSFSTRTEAPAFGDQLEVRLSAAGAGSTTGATATSVGDFTGLLLTLNSMDASAQPYPDSWTQYTLTMTGLGGPTSARLAFRYVVSDTSVAGDYIGIDTVTVSQAVPEPATLTLSLLGLAGAVRSWRSRKSAAV